MLLLNDDQIKGMDKRQSNGCKGKGVEGAHPC